VVDPKQSPPLAIPHGQDPIEGDEHPAQISPYYKPGEVAALFRRSTRTIRTWSMEGRLHRVKIDGATYYRRDEIDAVLAGDAENIIDKTVD